MPRNRPSAAGWILSILLLAGCASPSPEDAVQGGASIKRFDLPASLQWLATEKFRGAYNVEATRPLAKRMKEAGFNVLHAHYRGDTATLEKAARIADDTGMHLLASMHFLDRNKGYRSFVREDGTEWPYTICPATALLWQKRLVEPALGLIALKKKHPSVFGLVVDIEFYPGPASDGTWQSDYCSCDDCFASFLRSERLTPANIARNERRRYLRKNGLYEKYKAHNTDRVARVVAAAREKIRRADPDFLLGQMLYAYNLYSDAILRGLGDRRVPALSMLETTYDGYGRMVPLLERKFMEQQIPAVVIPGLWFRKNHATVTADLYQSAVMASGYWVYIGQEAGSVGFADVMTATKPVKDRAGRAHNPADWFRAYRTANDLIDSALKGRVRFPAPPASRFPKGLMEEYRRNLAGRFTRREATADRLTGEVRIDGYLNEEAWDRAVPLTGFRALRMDGLSRRPTTVRCLYGPRALYVAFRCREPKPKTMKTSAERRDREQLIMEENVELLLRTDPRSLNYFLFRVGPGGAILDAYYGSKTPFFGGDKWNGPWQAAALMDGDGWTVEMRIPYKTLGIEPPKPGTSLLVNFTRLAHTDTFFERSVWSNMETYGISNQPRHFSTLTFRDR